MFTSYVTVYYFSIFEEFIQLNRQFSHFCFQSDLLATCRKCWYHIFFVFRNFENISTILETFLSITIRSKMFVIYKLYITYHNHSKGDRISNLQPARLVLQVMLQYRRYSAAFWPPSRTTLLYLLSSFWCKRCWFQYSHSLSSHLLPLCILACWNPKIQKHNYVRSKTHGKKKLKLHSFVRYAGISVEIYIFWW